MLEKLRSRVETWLISLIDGYFGRLVASITENPETLDRFMPIADKVAERFIKRMQTSPGKAGDMPMDIPLAEGIAHMLPKKWKWLSPFAAPYLERFISSQPGQMKKEGEGKNPFE